MASIAPRMNTKMLLMVYQSGFGQTRTTELKKWYMKRSRPYTIVGVHCLVSSYEPEVITDQPGWWAENQVDVDESKDTLKPTKMNWNPWGWIGTHVFFSPPPISTVAMELPSHGPVHEKAEVEDLVGAWEVVDPSAAPHHWGELVDLTQHAQSATVHETLRQALVHENYG